MLIFALVSMASQKKAIGSFHFVTPNVQVMNKIVLIVAGGNGTRMQSAVPKQFMLLQSLPLLMYSLNIFHIYDATMEIRLVLPENEIDSWKQLCLLHNFQLEHTLFSGGETRFHSVKNGLNNIQSPSLIAVHDGVRPLVSQATIANCFRMAEELGTAIPVTPVKESIRKIYEDDSVAEDRTLYRLVQTPQVFHSDILLNAYNAEYKAVFTDDASVVESAGFKIYITDGNEENIKITTPRDMLIAEAFLNSP
jgi:2-C-methyl-D-erythritol 4-phosphate cytidylyltransferase